MGSWAEISGRSLSYRPGARWELEQVSVLIISENSKTTFLPIFSLKGEDDHSSLNCSRAISSCLKGSSNNSWFFIFHFSPEHQTHRQTSEHGASLQGPEGEVQRKTDYEFCS